MGATACRGGHVRVNGERVKPAYAVRVGDEVRLRHDGRERVVYHAPPGVAIEPGATFGAELYDDRLIIEGLDRRKLDAAAIGPPPELLFGWAEPAVAERIACTMNDGMAALVRARRSRGAV